jgi:hypothetical protein
MTNAVPLDAREAWRKTSCVPRVQVQPQLAQEAPFFSLIAHIGADAEVIDRPYWVAGASGRAASR